MLRALLAVAILACAAPAGARESLRQFHAETATPMAEIVAELKPRLPKTVLVQDAGETVLVSYSGDRLPEALGRFLAVAFPRADITPGRTLSLTVTLSELGGMTQMSLMVLGRFAPSAVPVPKQSVVMLDGTGPGRCEGQLVLSHPGSGEAAREAMLGHLKDAGFAFPDAAEDETSFFIGHAPDCSIALYFKPERGATLIVIRYLED